MLVVSDTSPISALVQIGYAELLHDLFGTVCIPRAVSDELLRFHVSIPAFIEVRGVVDRSRVDQFFIVSALMLGGCSRIVVTAQVLLVEA